MSLVRVNATDTDTFLLIKKVLVLLVLLYELYFLGHRKTK